MGLVFLRQMVAKLGKGFGRRAAKFDGLLDAREIAAATGQVNILVRTDLRIHGDGGEIFDLECKRPVTRARHEAVFSFCQAQPFGEHGALRPIQYPLLASAANFADHIEFAIFAQRAGLYAFDARYLRVRLESQRFAGVGFFVGFTRAHANLEASAFNFDLHRLRGDYALALGRARGVQLSDLAPVKQHTHPDVVGRRAVGEGGEQKNAKSTQSTQHGKDYKLTGAQDTRRTAQRRALAILASIDNDGNGMNDTTSYAVFLFPQAIETLGEVIKPYLSESATVGTHIVCSEIDPAGPFFTLTVQGNNAQGKAVEAELMLPHAFIRIVVSLHSEHGFGFGARENAVT